MTEANGEANILKIATDVLQISGTSRSFIDVAILVNSAPALAAFVIRQAEEIENLDTARRVWKSNAKWSRTIRIQQIADIAALRAALGMARGKLDAIREMAIEDLEKVLGGTNLYQIEADAHSASAAIDKVLNDHLPIRK